ncbi:MAG: PASTA domain-containing protein, partial [Nitrospirales bacterium]
GSSVAPGTAVALVISTGPAPVNVPNVVGSSQGAAQSTLTGAGLTVGNVTQQASGSVASGNVISQNPQAGSSVAPGTAVALVISTGPPGVNTFNDGTDANPGDQICETGTGNGICTLRAAIQEANALPGEQTISLPSGNYSLELSGQNEDNATTGDLDITDSLIIESSTGNATDVIISGQNLDRVFDIPQGNPTVTIRGLTIQDGSSSGSTGGGIRNMAGTLTVETSNIINNQSNGSGGGISHLDGSLTVQDTTISNNTSQGRGGGIQAANGTVTITTSQFTENEANFGGGLSTGEANVSVSNSSMTNNDANGGGGGIYKFLHLGDLFPNIQGPTVRIDETTLQGNLTNDCEGSIVNGSNNTLGNTTRCNLLSP